MRMPSYDPSDPALATPRPAAPPSGPDDAEYYAGLRERVQGHVRRYLGSDGQDGFTMPNGAPTLLLTTTGRRTGSARTTPLIFGQADVRIVVVASLGGADHHPSWYLNLLAQPLVQVQIKARTFAAHAETATGAERAQLWRHMVDVWPEYEGYQERTARRIPVVVLTPQDDDVSAALPTLTLSEDRDREH
jgi:deazaflavin-dependent oxidoreductase (nitroreductase family)